LILIRVHGCCIANQNIKSKQIIAEKSYHGQYKGFRLAYIEIIIYY